LNDGQKSDQNTISRAKLIMHEKINQNIDLNGLAASLGVGYSKFRIDFKSQTGFAPLQYFLLLKIAKAKTLLLNTNMSTKEIAFELGFESDLYFRRLFKKKENVTPNKFRRQNRR
jgi:AraC-like DNA-binding protein